MEYSLWNMHGPTLWPPASNVSRILYTSVNGETLGDGSDGLQVGPHEDITADGMQVGIHTQIHGEEMHSEIPTVISEMQGEIPTGLQGSGTQPEFIAMKPGASSNDQVNLLLPHEHLVLDHHSMVADSDSITLKMDTSPQKRLKVHRPRRSASGRELHDPLGLNISESVLPPVDNLWNNGIVGANVNVKTESIASYIDDPGKNLVAGNNPVYSMSVGRLPSKRLEPLSDESEEDDDDHNELNRLQEIGGSSINNQNLIPRLCNSSNKVGFECGECSFMADTRPGLKRHITVVHPAPAPDANLAHALMRKLSQSSGCPVAACRFRAGDKDEMEAHVARHVAEGCSPTPKKKSVPPNLQRVRYEREEYRCQMCSYSCTIEKAFYKHLKVHSTSLPPPNNTSKISCVICGKDRPTEADMNKHMRKHRDNRYFCCDICIFRTVQLKKLIQHRRMHTGEKPHLCPHCPYRSARRDNLRSHVRRVHKKDNLFCDTFAPRGLVLGPSVSSPTPSQD